MNGREIGNVEENAAEDEVVGERVDRSVDGQLVFCHRGTGKRLEAGKWMGKSNKVSLTAR